MDWKSELYDVVFILAGLLLMIVGGQNRGTILENLQAVGFVLTMSGTFITTALFEWITRHYMHIRLEIQLLSRPSEVLHCYVEQKGLETKHITRSFLETHVRLHWIVNHPYWGKLNEFKIQHHLDWASRVLPQPGSAVFKGNIIEHANSVNLIVSEVPGVAQVNEEGFAVPTFMLKYAPAMDSNFPTAIPMILKVLNQNGGRVVDLPKVFADAIKLEKLHQKLLATSSNSSALQSEVTRLKGENETLRAEAEGKSAKIADAEKMAFLKILDLHALHNSIEGIVKHIKSPFKGWLTTKTVVILGLTVIFAALLIMNPNNMFGQLGDWVDANKTFVLLALIFVVIFAAMFRWRKQK